MAMQGNYTKEHCSSLNPLCALLVHKSIAFFNMPFPFQIRSSALQTKIYPRLLNLLSYIHLFPYLLP